MTAIISSNIWDKRCQEKEQFPNPSECIREYWGELEQRYMHEISLPSGLEIVFDRFHFREAIIEQLSPHKLWPEFAFQVSGRRQLMNGNSHQGGENFLAIGRYPQGQQKWIPQQDILKVDIHIHPLLLREYIPQSSVEIPSAFSQLLNGEDEEFYFHCAETTPAMQVALHQMLNCPYQGKIRDLYLESKALELIALRLEQIITPQTHRRSHKTVAPIEQIQQAKEILCRNFHNPPSLITLARQVGLNDRKLKEGFRQVFGTTTFGYLHDYRMEKAREFFHETDMNINEVAKAVGYASRSSFYLAFRKKFGVSPSEYLQR